MANFSFDRATSSSDIKEERNVQRKYETTHYSIVDQFGNAIAATTTLNAGYGSKYYCDDLGFFLNNEMDDFSAKAGVPICLDSLEMKQYCPKKDAEFHDTNNCRKERKAFMTVGSPGGSTIITSVLQTILNVYEYNFSMQEAVNAPRFHHQWLPDLITFEPNTFNTNL
jgi:gamma-glutamyltranspeptidase/glutathione hydrolase